MNDDKILVLQCVSNMDRAGIETMLMNFYRNMNHSKIHFDFLCNKSKPGDYDDEIKSMGSNIFVTPGLSPFKWFKYQKYMKEFFSTHNYKIIHCQNEAMGFPALYAAKKAGIAVRISHSHNTLTRFDLKWPVKILYKYLLKTVATDYAACGEAAGKYLFGDGFIVIHNAIDTKKFVHSEKLRKQLREKYNLTNKFVIGHVGRFEPQKNHEFLIDLFNEYSKINDNAVLLLVGTGSLFDHIKDKVKALRLTDKVLFTGSINNVNEIYNVMDVFVLPSLHEGLPVVGIEAQYSGLQCIFSTNVTNECNISSNSKFIDLDIKKWLEVLSECYQSKGNVKANSIVNDYYDIKKESERIYNYYKKLYDRIDKTSL